MAWRLARSLERLRDQVNLLAPGRDTASDGTIGDEDHQQRESDHNPDAAGIVRAIDLTDDPEGGLSAERLAESLRASRDPRIKYVIWNERIFSSYSNPRRRAWEWGSSSGHRHHIHVSIETGGRAESDTSDWTLPGTLGSSRLSAPSRPDYRHGDYGLQPLDVDKPTVRRGGPNPDHKVEYLQGVLVNEAGEDLDISGSGYGTFGPQTERAVRRVQSRFGVAESGVVDWDGPDGRTPGPNATWPIIDRLALAATPNGPARGDDDRAVVPGPGALAAATAGFNAGFRGDDLATITMIAGRESRWDAKAVNPNTSDRGMWQINWNTVQGDGFTELRARLGLTADTDLLDLETNAAVAFFMYEDSFAHGNPWSPWRGSDTGRDGTTPGWDPNGSHLWRTEEFAAEARAAATRVERGADRGPTSPSRPTDDEPTAGHRDGTYTFTADDADGLIAVVGRCTGITSAPPPLRRAAAEAVATHNGTTFDRVWRPGDIVRFPGQIPGVRSYRVEPNDGLIAIAEGLGLGRDEATQRQIAEINAWQGSTPQPGDTWYGGAV